MNAQFWNGKTVFVTGHTGFKGSWLVLLLHSLGAHVVGYALPPTTEPNLFTLARVRDLCAGSHLADVSDIHHLRIAMQAAQPDVVLHLAAQPLVRESYTDPVGTYATNVMGTVHVLEAVRATPSVRACLVVTTDKCYENREWDYAYRESDALGGYDPYSSSKACAELVVSAYRRSFFSHGVSISTARAGNVIGGGDWSENRLVPDAMKAFAAGNPFIVRSPNSVRPWQHVLEPLAGYVELLEKQWSEPETYSDAFNFGPYPHQTVTVREVAGLMAHRWGSNARVEIADTQEETPHEAGRLLLDISRTCARLNWKPKFHVREAIDRTVAWYIGVYEQPSSARELCESDILFYTNTL